MMGMEFHGGLLFMLLLVVLPFWKICEKAGFSPWLSLLILVPLVNIGLLFFLAFAEWPRGEARRGAP